METKRRQFQGVLNILSFNRHFYVIGLTILLAIILSQLYFQWPQTLLWVIIGLFLYGILMPLIVSAYVYDFSGFYNFDWLKPLQLEDSEEKLMVNINAGFDETSYILKKKLPKLKIQVFDFYNAEQHTEPAIVRARKVSLTYPNTLQMKNYHIPIKPHTVDYVFLLSAAHEIRSFNEKVQFLKECHRICKPNGNVIMVEHLRDFPNFLAFSIGFTHFFSKSHWKKAFKSAGFKTFNETKFTKFMSVFNYQP